MRRLKCNLVAATSCLLTFALAVPAQSHEPSHDSAAQAACQQYEQDVREDIRLLSSQSAKAGAAQVPRSAPRIALARATSVKLHPQAAVRWAATPDRPMLDEGSYGGIVSIRLPSAGRYRISVSEHFWIDLVDSSGRAVPSASFAGRSECKPLNKLVDYEIALPGTYLIQFSGGTMNQVVVLHRKLDRT